MANTDAATSTGYAAYVYGGAITIVNRMLHENTVHSEIGLSQVLFMEVCGSLKNKSESTLLEALYLIFFTVLFLTTAHILVLIQVMECIRGILWWGSTYSTLQKPGSVISSRSSDFISISTYS